MMGINAASVSDLVSSIKEYLEEQFLEVMVQGEVTNLSPSSAGHWYFTLSDENASISCALFKGDALRNPIIRNLKNGDKIIISGPLSVYLKKGSFQLLVKRLLPAGEGQLKLQFERLKARLSQEGLFDLEKKKKLPLFPKKIAVITAEHGAALQDFINVMRRRSLWLDLIVIPAQVQGESAPKSLIQGIERAENIKDVDVIVLTRGGGSLEDLWAFNDENLIRRIYACSIPVISAVGHQVDFTLCDYVADYRSETPTAAAETLSQPQTELKARMNYCQTHLRSSLFKVYQHIQLLVQKSHPKELVSLIEKKIYDADKRLNHYRLIERAQELVGLPEAHQTLDEKMVSLGYVKDMKLKNLSEKLSRIGHVLSVLNPSSVLERGYTFVRSGFGEVISSKESFEKVSKGSDLFIQFKDGKALVIKG
jgi:exodeoxyribonuclease VII large subunit